MADWNDVQSAMEWLRLFYPDTAAELLITHMRLQSVDPDLDCQDCVVAESAVRGIVRQAEHVLEVFCRSEHAYRMWRLSPTTDPHASAIKELLVSAERVERARQILERLLLLGNEAYDRMRSPKDYQSSTHNGG